MSFSSKLLNWHKKQNRILPWQISPSPYKIWISEIMLQQTVLASVIKHYETWIQVFPDIEILAKASEKKILKIWEGLGYYSRAKNILKTAKILTAEYNGRLPDTYKDLTALPGIGDYTASAVLSMAYHKPYPVLDANVKRISQRLLMRPEWDKETENSVRRFLDDVLLKKNPGQFNEAIMHLGQKICLNSNPQCGICPVKDYCGAYKNNQQNLIPQMHRNKTVVIENYLIILLADKKIYMYQDNNKLFHGLWLLPKFPKTASLKELEEYIKEKWHIRKIQLIARSPKIIHSYTKYKDILYPHFYTAELQTKGKNWKSQRMIKNLPLPSVYRRLFDKDLPEVLNKNSVLQQSFYRN